MITSALSILITFSIVVFVHELGHFLTAISMGVRVYTFSLGFGPELFGITRKGIRYRISALPLGGYVKMKGESAEDEGAYESDGFMGQDPFKRIAILVAGPFMNFLTGMIIFSFVLYSSGLPRLVDKPVVGGFVSENTPAEKAGILPGDTVVSINDHEIKSWNDIAVNIESDKVNHMVLKRDEQTLSVDVKAEINKELNRPLIGIMQSYEVVKLGFFKSIFEGARYTVLLCVRLVEALWLMISGQMKAAIAGPVGIAQIVSKAANEGLIQLFQLIALISVNLGFLNLLPIPILDGGHIVFSVVEKIKGSPLDMKKVNIANIIGMSLLLTLLIFAMWQDIIRLFFNK
jgi:regulator of sigma E protease